MPITILIADDHKIVFDSLKSLFARQSDIRVVGIANNGRDAVKMARKMEPDVVIMDVSLPGLNGIEATRRIVAQVPGTKIVALSMHAERQFVKGILSAGASGYLTKNCSFDELTKAVRLVAANKKYLSPDVTGLVIEDALSDSKQATPSSFSVLTEREREVVQLLMEGKTVKQIGELLFLSVKTVYTHRNHAMRKLNVSSTAALIKRAVRDGVISAQD